MCQAWLGAAVPERLSSSRFYTKDWLPEDQGPFSEAGCVFPMYLGNGGWPAARSAYNTMRRLVLKYA